MLFAWDDWNVNHISRHSIKPLEAEFVVNRLESPWPEQKGEDKLLVWGATEDGRLLQVIFVLKAPEEVNFESLSIEDWSDVDDNDQIVYVIHAMELTPAMKKIYRKRRRPQ